MSGAALRRWYCPTPLRTALVRPTQPFDLAKELDHVVVLIFYLRDDAPGAAEDWRAIAAHEPPAPGGGVVIVGIAADSIAAHVRFARKLQLPFKLLSDRTRRRRPALRRRARAGDLAVARGCRSRRAGSLR